MANKLDIVKNGMFHTYENPQDLWDYFEKHSSTEKQMLYMGAMLMNNLMAAQLNGKYVEVEVS